MNFKPLTSIIKTILLTALTKTYKIFLPRFTMGTSCLLLNENNKVYLQKHRFWPKHSWGFPGGYLKSNESAENGIIREVFEESGLKIELIKQITIKKDSKTHFTIYFLGKIISSEKFKLQKLEIIDAGFFDISELPEPILKDHKILIEEIFS